MILKNGKRIDGCSDTVPVGTLNPFLGLTPPVGYLICQGQLVSKQLYPELYAICGDTFGTATATEFYLPDLRGKTITGYKEGDSTFGVLGALIGNLTHTHSTGNHTLTINEMPSHGHSIAIDEAGTGEYWTLKVFNEERQTTPGYGTSLAGGGQAHNHGDTSSASSLQPSINLNWIVKAVMLIPVNSIVENSLTSTSTTNALSAAQGKVLNDTINEIISTGSNSDGSWIKYADGTMICYGTRDWTLSNYVGVGALWYTDPQNWGNYPVSFIAQPTVTVSTIKGSLNIQEFEAGGASTIGRCWFMNGTQRSNVAVTGSFIAIGRWK